MLVFPTWAVAFIFPRVLGTCASPDKHARLCEGEGSWERAITEAAAAVHEMRSCWAKGGEDCLKGNSRKRRLINGHIFPAAEQFWKVLAVLCFPLPQSKTLLNLQ